MLNDDLNKISEWDYKWKILFNHDLTEKAQEVFFSRKNVKTDDLTVYFNEASVAPTSCQKHLGVHLDEELNFNHINEKLAKVNKHIGLIC